MQEDRYELPNKAPSYFHWIYNQPCTTNDLYGYSQKAYPNKPHPERPKNFFDKIRPFSPLGFYPDLRNDWTLSAAHTRAGPRFSKRPSRTFCPRAVLNRYNIMNGYVPEHIPAIDRVEVPDLPRGVHVYMPDCEPTPPYCRPKPRARVNLMWNILPGVVTHNKSHPGIPEDKVYSTPIPRRPPSSVDKQSSKVDDGLRGGGVTFRTDKGVSPSARYHHLFKNQLTSQHLNDYYHSPCSW